jgi:glycosyltransferase involved in cell wall biosynthesis
VKILISAWACNPLHGSEAAVGWNWIEAIKDRHDVHVLTASHQRKWIEEELRMRPGEFARVRFHYLESPRWRYSDDSRFWRWQANKPLLVFLFHRYYRRWMRVAYDAGFELKRKYQIDLVHQLTLVGFRFPGHLWKFETPFVWGPIGGLENTRWRLLPSMGARGAAYYSARNIVNSLHKKFSPAPRKAFGRASAVLAATAGIQDEIRRWYGVSSEVISEVSAPPEVATEFAHRAPGEPLRIVWSGQHLPGKALNLLLVAVSRVPNSVNWQLDIFGDGPSKPRWERLARKHRIGFRCTWHGQLSRDEALRGLRDSHLLVITSLKDLTSTVCIEALACGVPILCPDHCGFADAVTSDCGIRLPIDSARQFISGLSNAIAVIDQDEEYRRRLAAGALRRASDFSLERKTERISQIYSRVDQKQRSCADGQVNQRERDKTDDPVAAEAR